MRQVLREAMTFAALAVAAGACTVEDVKDTRSADSLAAATSKNPPKAPAAASRMRLEVDLSAKRLTAFDGDSSIATYRIAVGSPQWPTQTGQWDVTQVVWNPEFSVELPMANSSIFSRPKTIAPAALRRATTVAS